ncbi:hypothetical protein Tsp_02624 [Trichinella spiralis]|uniref:hypothetical protein n=1 Tax=Trichinella spiralis TaxID=6334 RepID=UPI0001EFBBAC|nr:hypothetical protein Tsp_02624 [Trichinella spiralis]
MSRNVKQTVSESQLNMVTVPIAPHCFHYNCSTNITSSPELLWSFICSGHRDKSYSDHFVLNVASQITLRQSRSAGARIDLSLLRYPMKLVPLATLVHMDIKAFPSRPIVPLLITNTIVYQ